MTKYHSSMPMETPQGTGRVVYVYRDGEVAAKAYGATEREAAARAELILDALGARHPEQQASAVGDSGQPRHEASTAPACPRCGGSAR